MVFKKQCSQVLKMPLTCAVKSNLSEATISRFKSYYFAIKQCLLLYLCSSYSEMYLYRLNKEI